MAGDGYAGELVRFQVFLADGAHSSHKGQLAKIRQLVDDENTILATHLNAERMREKMKDEEVFTTDQFEQSLGVLAGCLRDIRGLFK